MNPGQVRKTIGPYQVQDVIGHGGMATVYKAFQPELDRTVAIKVLLPAFVNDAAFRFRFQREARLIARLRHPNIVVIYGVGEDEGMPYLVMEYLQGTTLHAAIRQRRRQGAVFSPVETLELLRPLASALDYAHTRDVVHRDLKPENIILTGDGPVITDFGLAKLVQEEAATVSVVMGTPSYMAPEQIRAEPVDRRADVYALGIMLYELLAGQVPFTGITPVAVAQAHLSQPPPALANLHPHLRPSPLLDEVARRAIAKRKADRWPSAGAMVEALARAVDEMAVAPPRATMPGRPLFPQAPGVPSPPPLSPPARLKRPPASDNRVGRFVLLIPLAAMLVGSLWGARVLSRQAGLALRDERSTAVPATVEAAATAQPSQTASRTPDLPAVFGTTYPTATSALPGDTALPTAGSTPSPAPTPDGRVRGIVRTPAGTGANLRGGPGRDYNVVTGAPDGMAVTALSQANGWFEIVAESGERAWIAASLVEIQGGDVASLPRPDVLPPRPALMAPTPALPAPQPRPAAPQLARSNPTVTPVPPPSPAPPPPSPTTPPAPPTGGTTIRLEDTAFRGGWRNPGASVYGGRSATWVYGQGSGRSSMSATFDVPALVPGQATLTIMGMDSEDAAKTPMRVVVNDTVIFEGANPLPNDDIPLQSGRWDNLNLPFDTAVLQAGANTVTITNLASGGVNAPPFIAVDYAIVQLP